MPRLQKHKGEVLQLFKKVTPRLHTSLLGTHRGLWYPQDGGMLAAPASTLGTATQEDSSQHEERPGQKRTLWQGKTLVMKAGRKEGSGRAGRPRVPLPQPSTPTQPQASSPGSNRTITARPAATPRRGKLKCPFDPCRAGVGKQEARAMIRKGFLEPTQGAALLSSQQVPCGLRPSRPSVRPPAPRPS